MTRLAVAGLAALLAGCAGYGVHAGGPSAACPARYVLACDVSPSHREVDPETCSCVRTSDVAAITSSHRPAGFRMRIRN
jgi:hypothetical protein